MSKKLELVARAIYERDYGNGPTLKPWTYLVTAESDHYRGLARAAAKSLLDSYDHYADYDKFTDVMDEVLSATDTGGEA
jgi:hypothetical protein